MSVTQKAVRMGFVVLRFYFSCRPLVAVKELPQQ